MYSNFKLSKPKRPRRLAIISSRAKKTQGTEHEAYVDTEREDNNQVVTTSV